MTNQSKGKKCNDSSKTIRKTKPRNFKSGRPNRSKNVGTSDMPDVPVIDQDPFFYASNDAAIKNMGSIPWLEVVGSSIGKGQDRVAGALVATYLPTIGGMGSSTGNYATRAARAFYNYVVQGYTGGVDFEAPDLLMTSVAGAALASLFMMGRRAFSILHYYLQFNTYYAKTLVEACGFSFDDLAANMADFRAEFNLRVAQFNATVVVPKGFKLIDRWLFITSQVFTDTDSPEYSTAFLWKMAGVPLYDATSMTTGTSLQYLRFGDTFTVKEYFEAIDKCIDALNDDDVRSIFGAVKRVYSDDQILHLTEVTDNESFALVRNDIVAEQFHNMYWHTRFTTPGPGSVVGYADGENFTSGNDGYDVMAYQDANGNIITPIYGLLTGPNQTPFTPGFGEEDDDILIDLYDGMDSPGNVLDVTANMQVQNTAIDTVTISVSAGQNYVYAGMSCRAEVVTGIIMYVASEGVTGYTTLAVNKGGGNPYPISLGNSAFFHVDSHPIICVSESMVATTDSYTNYRIGEIDKYTVVNREYLVRLHDRCLYQLLAMPANSKSVT